MNRAYSVWEVKSVDDDARIIKGVASSITPDRMEDIVEPSGAKFKLPLPLLSQHEHHLPIGHVTTANVGYEEIEVEASVVKDSGLDYIETAWKQLKAGLVRGFSIGFRPLEYAFIDGSYGIHFKEWDWYELSVVTIPANVDAKITTIKSYDQDPSKRLEVVGDDLAGLSNVGKLALARKRLELANRVLAMRK